jgi:plasmid stabilization system protein ParE
MVGTERGLADGQRALGQFPRVGQPGMHLQVARGTVQQPARMVGCLRVRFTRVVVHVASGRQHVRQ